MFTKKGIFSSSSGNNDQTFQFPSSFYSWVASLLILIVSTSTAWADYAPTGRLMEGWDINFCFLGASLTLPFVRGDSKFKMGDRKCPLDVRGEKVKSPAHQKIQLSYKMQFLIDIYQALLYYSGHTFIRGYFSLCIFSCTKQRRNFHKASTCGCIAIG